MTPIRRLCKALEAIRSRDISPPSLLFEMKFKADQSQPQDSKELREEAPRKPPPVRLNFWHRGRCRKHKRFVCHCVRSLEESTHPVSTVSYAVPEPFAGSGIREIARSNVRVDTARAAQRCTI